MQKRPNKLLDNIIASSTSRARKDIRAWRSALQQAESTQNPRRALLYNLYDEIILDAHLSAEIQKRSLVVSGSMYAVFEQSDGSTNTEKTTLLTKPWFHKFINLAIESHFFGHSLMQIGEIQNGEITDVSLINRKHVIPEKGLFIFQEVDEKGIFYREDKKYVDWLLEIGENSDLGILNKTVPHVLYKRFAQSAWSEFTELFGMPIRVAKTNVKNDENLNRMEQMMISMGAGQFSIIDENENIEFIETTRSNGEVYNNLIDRSNSEISKLITGAVIGEASQGGSRSKEEVGERTSDKITTADKQFLEKYINYTLFPKLIRLGYPLQGTGFRFEKSKDVRELWKITEGLLKYKEVDNEFITKTFGIPVADKVSESAAALKHKNNAFDPFM